MTYRELKQRLDALTEEQLNQESGCALLVSCGNGGFLDVAEVQCEKGTVVLARISPENGKLWTSGIANILFELDERGGPVR